MEDGIIFSLTLKNSEITRNFLVPDRDQVTMTSPFMSAYSKRVIQVCHKRGVHAMGGMAAQIPVKNNEEETNWHMQKFVQTKNVK